jgi:prevent-host-death family protein
MNWFFRFFGGCQKCVKYVFSLMMKVSATTAAREFANLLSRVEHGETVQIQRHGKPVARLVRDVEFISGSDMAKIMEGHTPDPATADAIETEIKKLRAEELRDAQNH